MKADELVIGGEVYGVRCGKFRVEATRMIGRELVADCREIGPGGQLARRKLVLPPDCLSLTAPDWVYLNLKSS